MRFNSQRDNLALTQRSFADASARASLQKKDLTNYDRIGGTKDLLRNRNQIRRYETMEKNETAALSEVGLMSTTLAGLKNILDKIKSDALEGGSDTAGADELDIMGQALRGIAKDFFDGANTQFNGKYLFAGLASEQKVFDIGENEIFVNGTYLGGTSYADNRIIEGKKASVGLDSLFSATEASANYTGSVPGTLPLAANAEINLIVNDGRTEYNVGDIALSAGDSLANIVTKINAAFNAAGGQGSIVQASGGALDFDTDLITNNLKNSNAAIIINPGSSLPNTLDELGLEAGNTFGTSTNIQNAFTKLENAYNSQDNQLVRESIVDIQDAIDRLTLVETELGDVEAKFTEAVQNHFNIRTDLEIKESELATLPIAEAIQQVNATRAGLSGAMQASQLIMQASIFNFLSL